MMTLNKVLVAGNLTRDPEVRQVPTGQSVGTFGLAINEHYTTKDGEEKDEVCFIEIEVWGKQAEHCGQYLRKGQAAFIEGRLRLGEWDDRETGQKRSRIRIRADRVQFLGGNRSGTAGRPATGTGRGDQAGQAEQVEPWTAPPSRPATVERRGASSGTSGRGSAPAHGRPGGSGAPAQAPSLAAAAPGSR